MFLLCLPYMAYAKVKDVLIRVLEEGAGNDSGVSATAAQRAAAVAEKEH